MKRSVTRNHRTNLRLETLEQRHLLTGLPVISEFMASNRDSLLDGDTPPGSPDWIELYNAGDEAVNLEGWYLTDDPEDLKKWRFPATTLNVSDFKIVFASGDDAVDPAGNLHTNFRLSAGGEYLGLVKPDGTSVVSDYGSAAEDYPRQATDISFGRVMVPVQKALVSRESAVRFLVPTSESAQDWTQTDFVDAPELTNWSELKTPLGYSDSAALQALIQNDVSGSMQGLNSSAWLRIPFETDEAVSFDALTLQVAADDGFVAYLNGTRIASQNAPESLTHDAQATAFHHVLGKSLVVDPTERAIWYSFEDDGGQSVTDQLTADGSQEPVFNSDGSVDTRSDQAAFGERSLRLPGSPGPPNIFNRIQLPETRDLGSQFTLAMHVNAANRHQRLFSNFNGTGAVGSERLIFDIDPSGQQIPGIRFIIGNRGVLQTDAVPSQLQVDGYHHFAATYDDGLVQLYLDGELVASGQLGNGPLEMPLDLFVGEDPHDGGGTANEQLAGNVDDLLVLCNTALPATDLELLAQQGGEALFETGGRDIVFEEFDVIDQVQALRQVHNVLAIQALNSATDDDDFFIAAELIGEQPPDRFPPGFFPDATPGEINGVPLKGLVEQATFSRTRGFYSEPFEVDLTAATPGASLIYTLDGSEPTLTNGTIISPTNSQSAPVGRLLIETTTTLRVAAVKEGYLPSKAITHSYVFLADVLRQPKLPEGHPKRWGRMRADYEMDPEIVDQSPYQETILDDLKSLPSVSLTIDTDDFFGSEGIYSNTVERGRSWEKPVSVEYFDPKNNDQFQIDAGLRVHGGYSRQPEATPQHSLRMHFRNEYGEGKLRFPLFADSTVDEFDSLVLNAQSSDNWTSINTTTGRIAQFMRDQWAQDMQREMGHPHVPGKYVHVYINGMYWGLYGLMERPDDDFAAAHLGGDDEEYDVIVDEIANSGNLTAWNELLRRVRSEEYDRVPELLDVDNFIDYMIVNIYMGNWDWPDHNWNAVRRRADGERFTFLVWDSEVGLGIGVNYPGPIKERILDVDLAGRRRDVGTVDTRNGPGEIYRLLKKDPEFRLQFADRLQQHLFNDGALTSSRAAEVYQARANEIEAALVGQAARWGDVRRRTPDVPDGVWAAERDWILNEFFVARPTIVLEDFRDEQLFPNVSAPEFNRHGGAVKLGFELTLSHETPAAQILFTLDGTDPRQPGGEISPTALSYDQAISIRSATSIRSRALLNGEWSALTQASLTLVDHPGDFNQDGSIDHADIATMCLAIRTSDPSKDLTEDGQTNTDDLVELVTNGIGSTMGDANLDGQFNSSDLVQIFQAGQYDDDLANNSVWATGDWNCDGEFDSSDLVFAFQFGGYAD